MFVSKQNKLVYGGKKEIFFRCESQVYLSESDADQMFAQPPVVYWPLLRESGFIQMQRRLRGKDLLASQIKDRKPQNTNNPPKAEETSLIGR